MSQEELLEEMKPTIEYEEGCYRLYVIFEREDIALNEGSTISLSEKSEKRMLHSPIHHWDEKRRNYTKAFKINKYPTFLIVDHAGLALQTTDLQEADDFLSSQVAKCE